MMKQHLNELIVKSTFFHLLGVPLYTCAGAQASTDGVSYCVVGWQGQPRGGRSSRKKQDAKSLP
jgi:hypothetical protein